MHNMLWAGVDRDTLIERMFPEIHSQTQSFLACVEIRPRNCHATRRCNRPAADRNEHRDSLRVPERSVQVATKLSNSMSIQVAGRDLRRFHRARARNRGVRADFLSHGN